MVQSMTGFGSAEQGGFRVEIRSLNHRFMEMFIKLPPALGRHEMAMREALKKKFSRGKFDVFVSPYGAGGIRLALNSAVAGEVRQVLDRLKEGCGVSGEIGLDHLLQWKDLFIEEDVSYEEAPLFEAFEEALSELEKMRLREGEAVASDISARVDAIARLNEEVIELVPDVREKARDGFFEVLKELLGESPIDEARILQEASSVAEKSDISEEVSRIGSHCDQMGKILDAGGTIGRKLDFLLQELHREANTIASKSNDGRILHNVVEMKAEIERAREQAQNIQ